MTISENYVNRGEWLPAGIIAPGAVVPILRSGAASAILFADTIELSVVRVRAGIVEPMIEGTHYSALLDDPLESFSSMTITTLEATITGEEWQWWRQTPPSQQTDYTPLGKFPAQSHEDAIDKLTRMAADGMNESDRAIRIPNEETAKDPDPTRMELPNILDREGKFISFDSTGRIVMGEGSGGSDSVIATHSTESRTHSDRWGQVRNPMDFGAKGDGSTDDSDAIQACFDAWTQWGGKIVFPEQRVFIAKNLIIDASGDTAFFIQGNGCRIQAAPDLAGNEMILRNKDQIFGADKSIFMDDLTFDGDGIGSGGVQRTEPLVKFQSVEILELSRVRVHNTQNIGLMLSSCLRPTVLNCLFDDCGWDGASSERGAALWIGALGGFGSRVCTDIIIDNCEFFDNRWTGIHASGHRMFISSCLFNNNVEFHIRCQEDQHQTIRDLNIDGNILDNLITGDSQSIGINVEAGHRMRINDNMIRNCEQSGIRLDKVQDLVVSANSIGNCGTSSVNGVCLEVLANGSGVDRTKNLVVSDNIFYDDTLSVITDLGLDISGSGEDMKDVTVYGNVFTDNLIGANGVFNVNNRWKIENNCKVSDNAGANDPPLLASGQNITLAGLLIEYPRQVLVLSGVSQIQLILGGQYGQIITLYWGPSCTARIQHGITAVTNTIKLVGAVDLNGYVEGDSLELFYDGTFWREFSRSL